MTTTTHTVAAMLAVAVAALETQNAAHKKETGSPLYALGTDLGNGVKFRELKAWLKDLKAKQKEVSPTPKAEPAKAPRGKREPSKLSTISDAINPKAAGNVRDLELSKSSNIESAVYNRDTKTLRITFKNGSVYDYANVGIREANNFEKAESAGVWFKENIKGQKDTTKIKAAGKTADAAPAAKVKPAAKAVEAKPAAKAAPAAVEYTASELRGSELLNGRKVELIAKVVTNKTTGNREVITASGARYEIAALRKNNRGRFVVQEIAPAAKPAAKAETVKEAKATAKAAARTSRTNRKADLNDDVKEAANNARKSKPLPALPKSSEVRGQQVRVIKGAKDKMVLIERIVNRDGVRMAITENRFPLPYGQIIVNDGVLTYTGKLTAEEFRAA